MPSGEFRQEPLPQRQGRGYEAYLEGRGLDWRNKDWRVEREKQWKRLRRRWYLGEESFLETLAVWLKGIESLCRRPVRQLYFSEIQRLGIEV